MTKKQKRMGELFDRMVELEKEANERYLENTDWSDRLEALTDEEQEEYRELYNEYYGQEFYA